MLGVKRTRYVHGTSRTGIISQSRQHTASQAAPCYMQGWEMAWSVCLCPLLSKKNWTQRSSSSSSQRKQHKENTQETFWKRYSFYYHGTRMSVDIDTIYTSLHYEPTYYLFAVAFAFEAHGWCCTTETFLLSTVTHVSQQALFFSRRKLWLAKKKQKKTMYIRRQ